MNLFTQPFYLILSRWLYFHDFYLFYSYTIFNKIYGLKVKNLKVELISELFTLELQNQDIPLSLNYFAPSLHLPGLHHISFVCFTASYFLLHYPFSNGSGSQFVL